MKRERKARIKAKTTLVQIETPTDLLGRFDRFWPSKYASRSEAIREGMTLLLNHAKPKQPVPAEVPTT